MRESLKLYNSLKALDTFKQKKVYVLLNKVDIFRRMISEIAISDYFFDYTGGADPFNACKFFADKFSGATTKIYPMSAVDSASVSDVCLCIRDSLERDLVYRNFIKRLLSRRDSSQRDSSEPGFGSYISVTAWSWASMDLEDSRERRDYMMTEVPSPSGRSKNTSSRISTSREI